MDSKEFKSIVHGMRAQAAKKMREKYKPWGYQGNNTVQYMAPKMTFRPKIAAITTFVILWIGIIGMVVLAVCM